LAITGPQIRTGQGHSFAVSSWDPGRVYRPFAESVCAAQIPFSAECSRLKDRLAASYADVAPGGHTANQSSATVGLRW